NKAKLVRDESAKTFGVQPRRTGRLARTLACRIYQDRRRCSKLLKHAFASVCCYDAHPFDYLVSIEVPVQVRYIRITAEQAGQRIDNLLLRELKGVPKSRIYRLLRRGEVRVNGGRSDPSYKLAVGDEVRLPPVRVSEHDAAAPPPGKRLLALLEAAIVYEDSTLLALNKPAGVAVHGGSGVRHGAIAGPRTLRPEAPFLEPVRPP